MSAGDEGVIRGDGASDQITSDEFTQWPAVYSTYPQPAPPAAAAGNTRACSVCSAGELSAFFSQPRQKASLLPCRRVNCVFGVAEDHIPGLYRATHDSLTTSNQKCWCRHCPSDLLFCDAEDILQWLQAEVRRDLWTHHASCCTLEAQPQDRYSYLTVWLQFTSVFYVDLCCKVRNSFEHLVTVWIITPFHGKPENQNQSLKRWL